MARLVSELEIEYLEAEESGELPPGLYQPYQTMKMKRQLYEEIKAEMPKPRTRGAVDARESFYLGMARRAYLMNQLSIDEFEENVYHVLRGGHLNADGRIPEPLAEGDPGPLLHEMERK